MSQYTIRRKLFAFKAEAWEGIKSHKGESAEADKHYEAYKRKYAKEIEEHERGSFRANTSSSNQGSSNKKSSTNTNKNHRAKTGDPDWDKFWDDFEKDWNKANEDIKNANKRAEESAKRREEEYIKREAERKAREKMQQESAKRAKRNAKIGLGLGIAGVAGVAAYDYLKNRKKNKQKSKVNAL